ncbi:MAG: hypothetical protein H6581_22170 [Bacteroidia bacterium]|nr:hypothetical protein [Bacteroidia bacterium]
MMNKRFLGQKLTRWLALSLLAGVIYLSSCAPARFVRPLEKGQSAVSGTFGGPLIGFGGLTIPIPFTTVGYGYGLKENLTLQGHLHTTSLLFGVVQMDAGATYGALKPSGWKPGLSVTPAFNFAASTWDGKAKIWPILDLNAYWEYGKEKNHYAYLGLSNWFELAGTKAHGEKVSQHWLPNIQAGNVFSRSKWDYILEIKYLAPGVQSQNLVVEYKSFGQTGAVGINIGFVRKF